MPAQLLKYSGELLKEEKEAFLCSSVTLGCCSSHRDGQLSARGMFHVSERKTPPGRHENTMSGASQQRSKARRSDLRVLREQMSSFDGRLSPAAASVALPSHSSSHFLPPEAHKWSHCCLVFVKRESHGSYPKAFSAKAPGISGSEQSTNHGLLSFPRNLLRSGWLTC